MRCLLFTPALRSDRAAKAWSFQPDSVILDLEDAVAADRKIEARNIAAQTVSEIAQPWTVRINALDTVWWKDDLTAVLHANLAYVIVPKADTAETIQTINHILSAYEATVSRATPIKILPIIESVQGLANARVIGQASPRVSALTFGEGDFSLDLGIDWDSFGTTLTQAKVQLVLESRLAGLEPPHAGVYPRLQDPEGLERSCQHGKSLGFGAKHCIHPEQIPTIRRVFSPSEKAVKRAREIVVRFEEALKAGQAAIMVGSEFIDYPVYHRAQQTLKEAQG